MAMTEAEMCENALGHRSRYVKGLCFSPKSAFAFKSRQTSSQHEVELENILSETQLLMEAQQKQLDTQHNEWSPRRLYNNKEINNNLKRYCIIYNQVNGPYDFFFVMYM